MHPDDDVKILNALIGATMDSARHYRKVAGSIGNPRIRTLFEHLSTQRKMIARRLQDQLAVVGGNPLAEGLPAVPSTRLSGRLRHAMSYGYCALVDEVERGEEHVKARYERALQDGKLSRLSRTAVQHAYASVREGEARMHALKRYPQAGHARSERLEQW
jgi:uncharacterized protein (TIGR02284 family)